MAIVGSTSYGPGGSRSTSVGGSYERGGDGLMGYLIDRINERNRETNRVRRTDEAASAPRYSAATPPPTLRMTRGGGGEDGFASQHAKQMAQLELQKAQMAFQPPPMRNVQVGTQTFQTPDVMNFSAIQRQLHLPQGASTIDPGTNFDGGDLSDFATRRDRVETQRAALAERRRQLGY